MAVLNMQSRENKVALDFWDEYYKSIQFADQVDTSEPDEDKSNRIKRLEANPEEWFMYYFEKYCTATPMPFHTKSTKRVLNNPEWYEVRPWARELSKSGRTMLELLYLHCTGKKKFTLMISATKDAAERLLEPYKLAFEKNLRLRNDYGNQVRYGSWTSGEFTTNMGGKFLAVGAGNAPRGARNENIRPDSIIMDDFDTDAECRNPELIENKWKWFEEAVYATRSIDSNTLIIFNGNIIAEHCCIKKAIKMADHYEIVNIRDKEGKSTWPTKNTEKLIDRALSKISKESAQKEYFNNPIVMGKVFERINYGRIRPLKDYKFLIAYTDPSYKKNGDTKATALIGKYKDEYHIIKMYCGHVSTAQMLDWQYEILNYVADKVAVYFMIEWPWIDDMLKQEIKLANARHNITLALKADERKKPDKFYRIESNLEPLNRNFKLIFNESLKESESMIETEFQFKALSPKSRAHDDAPDAVEGAVWTINNKVKQNTAPPKLYNPKQNQKRY